MRKLLNGLLRPLGYRLEKIRQIEVQLDRLLQRRPGFKFVQIGAHDGVRFDTLYPFVTANRLPGVVVEPLPDVFEQLRRNFAHHPTVVAVNTAIHASERQVSIYRSNPAHSARLEDWAAGIASFDRLHLLRHGVPADCIVEQKVECQTVMELLEGCAALDAQYLQIDTEGYDGQIVRMIDFSRFRPSLIKYEHKNLPHGEQAELLALLRRQGYTAVREIGDTVAWRVDAQAT